MKKLVLVLALCAFTFASCGDDDENNGTISSFDGTITGTLKKMNWNGDFYTLSDVTDEVDEIHAMIYNEEISVSEHFCSATVTNGKFSIKLPTPNAEHLDAIGNLKDLKVSDKTVKTASVSFFRCSKNEAHLGNPYLRSANADEVISVEFVYVDSHLTVTGTTTDNSGFATEYNANFKKGWNTLIYKGVSDTKGTVTTESISANLLWVVSIIYDWDYEVGSSTETKRGFKSFGK